MTWRALLEHLAAAGHPAPEAAAALADPAVNPPPVPWLVRVLVGAGAWIAAWFLLGSLALCVGLLIGDSSTELTIVGAIVLVSSVVLRRVLPGAFAAQLTLSMGVAGQLLLATGISTSDYSVTTIALFWGALSLALVWLHPDSPQRFASTLVGITAVGVLLYRAAPSVSADALLVVVTALLLAVSYAPERLLPATASYARGPVRIALVVVLLFLCLLGEWLDLPAELGAGDLPVFTVAPYVVGGGLVLAIGLALRAHRTSLFSEAGALSIVTVVALGALGQGKPGLLGALLGMVVSFHGRDRLGAGVATAFLVVFGVHFYYDLALTLWVKAGVLVGSGLVLLAVRGYLHLRKFSAEAA